jgi:hypothetical protein
VSFIDVGQGDGVFVQAGGESYLIDARGHEEGPNVVDFARSRGVDSLDGIVVADTAAEQLRAIREVADPIAREIRRAHARYRALCKEIEDLGLAEAVWKWRERRDEQFQIVLQQLHELPYYSLNTLTRVQANPRVVHTFVDEDERALAGRRAELVLNEYLAREVNAGWVVLRRAKLRAAIATITKTWRGRNKYHVREVGLDPSGKVVSTIVGTASPRGVNYSDFSTSVDEWPVSTTELPPWHGWRLDEDGFATESEYKYNPCEYCWCHENIDDRPDHPCQKGELELFP